MKLHNRSIYWWPSLLFGYFDHLMQKGTLSDCWWIGHRKKRNTNDKNNLLVDTDDDWINCTFIDKSYFDKSLLKTRIIGEKKNK